MTAHAPSQQRHGPAKHQQGVVLIMTLICLVLMLVAAVALTRSSTNSLLQAGNFSFKRDLLNQAERGFALAVYNLSTDATLSLESKRKTNQLEYNYSATQLASNDQGIPLVLINDTTFSSAGMAQSDLTDDSAQVAVRTVIDRLCTSSGAFSNTTCAYQAPESPLSGTARLRAISANAKAIYRISVRVTGPRNTQTFQQMTVALP